MPYHVCLNDICTRMCDDAEVTCYYDLACITGFWPENWGFCPLVDFDCNLFNGSGCPGEGESCYVMLDIGLQIHTVCLHTGTSTGPCMGEFFNECAPGYLCFESECHQLCDSDHNCNGVDCSMFVDLEIGVCL
jgi:hypothetical protein